MRSPARGALVRRAGVGVNFGIVADVTADSDIVHLPARARHLARRGRPRVVAAAVAG